MGQRGQWDRAAASRACLAATILLLVPHAAAVDEADAPAAWQEQFGTDWVEAAGHSPDPVPPGTQWQGFIRFAAGHNITEARYQICRVGEACFAPPILAASDDGRTFRFDTAHYKDPVYDEPIRYEAGWRIGVQWVLTMQESDGPVLFPEGIPFSDPRCDDDPVGCSETHYIAFDMAEAKRGEDVPGMHLVLLTVALLVVAALRRRP